MGFRNGAYATIWEVKPGKGNYSDTRLSTSKKNKQTGNYDTDFSGFVRFVGKAHEDISAMTIGDRLRIKIGECETTNYYNKEKNVTYTNHAVFTFEIPESNGSAPAAKQLTGKEDFMNVPEEAELPFE